MIRLAELEGLRGDTGASVDLRLQKIRRARREREADARSANRSSRNERQQNAERESDRVPRAHTGRNDDRRTHRDAGTQDQGNGHPTFPWARGHRSVRRRETGIPFFDHMLESFAKHGGDRPPPAREGRPRGRSPPHRRRRRASRSGQALREALGDARAESAASGSSGPADGGVASVDVSHSTSRTAPYPGVPGGARPTTANRSTSMSSLVPKTSSTRWLAERRNRSARRAPLRQAARTTRSRRSSKGWRARFAHRRRTATPALTDDSIGQRQPCSDATTPPTPRVAVVDYGAGNLRSRRPRRWSARGCGRRSDGRRRRALARCGRGRTTRRRCAFGDATQRACAPRASTTPSGERASRIRPVPIWGFASGLQLLFDASEEHGEPQGLRRPPRSGAPAFPRTEPTAAARCASRTSVGTRCGIAGEHPMIERGFPSRDVYYFVHSLPMP